MSACPAAPPPIDGEAQHRRTLELLRWYTYLLPPGSLGVVAKVDEHWAADGTAHRDWAAYVGPPPR